MQPTLSLPRASLPVVSYGFDVGGAIGGAWDRYGPQVIDAAGRAVTSWATEQLTGGSSSAAGSGYYATTAPPPPPPSPQTSPVLLLGAAVVALLLLKGGG